jgi:hypothetical protein
MNQVLHFLKTILLLLLYLPNTLLYFIVKRIIYHYPRTFPKGSSHGIFTRDLHTGSSHGIFTRGLRPLMNQVLHFLKTILLLLLYLPTPLLYFIVKRIIYHYPRTFHTRPPHYIFIIYAAILYISMIKNTPFVLSLKYHRYTLSYFIYKHLHFFILLYPSFQ